MADRLVAVPERALADVLDLAERALTALTEAPVRSALRGAIDEVKVSMRDLEPA